MGHLHPLLNVTHNGAPVPFMRPRFNGRRGFNHPKYAAYKKALSSTFNTAAGDVVWNFPKPSTKERSKWLKGKRYQLSVQVYTVASRGDLDNYIKSVCDALQDAGVIADDVQIDSYKEPTFKTVDKENPRISVQLWEMAA